MDRVAIIDAVKRLGLPADDFVVVSSAALAMRGIREAKDIDIVVTPCLWKELSTQHSVDIYHGVERIRCYDRIEILNPHDSVYGDKGPVPLADLITEADVIDGIRFNNLDHLKAIKRVLAREKDLRDIAIIDTYRTSAGK